MNSNPQKTHLDGYWMPFTANRAFKANPRLMASAAGMHYRTVDGRQILDGTSGLWCTPLGHAHPGIVAAVQQMVATLDYSPAFQIGHPAAFQLADELLAFAGGRFSQAFFTNSGSEAADTALKIALAWHSAKGDRQRVRLVGRERAYHGVGFGGMSVGGIPANRTTFGQLLPAVDHLPHTHNLEHNAFTRGQPAWGAHLADELEAVIARHGAQTIAAVIVEPVAGSTGLLIPPKGYLQRLRAICDQHGILLIFDEVITGFGRLAEPFGMDRFGVVPDLMCVAKGLTNGVIPMGAVLVKPQIHDAFMHGPDGVELFHGYTYSGHPVACAAGLASLAAFRDEGVLDNARSLASYWEDAVHSLRQAPHVIDIRNMGIAAAIELAPLEGRPGARAFDIFRRAFEEGVLIRVTGDTIALSPPLILQKAHIDELIGKLGDLLKSAGTTA